MAPCGAIPVSAVLVFVVVAMFDDHHVVVMAAPAVIAVVVAMIAILGARAVVTVAVSDHDVLSACNRRRCDRDRAKCGKNVSKPLHVFSSIE
jgi:hypothetical protein